MPTTLNFNTVNEAMKIHYRSLRVKEMVYKNNPLLAMMPKYESFGGLSMPIPIIYGNPQRTGAIFADAQNIPSTSSLSQFSITRVKDYSFATVDAETIKASRGDANAFLRYLTMEIDGAIHTIKRRLAFDIYGDGTSSLGSISASATIPASGVLPDRTMVTLTAASDVTKYEVGMILQFFDVTGATARVTAGPPTPLTETGAFQVTAVDRDGGTVTVDRLITSIASTDVVYAFGNFIGTAAATSAGVKVNGLAAWIPSDRSTLATHPLAEDFNGVVRSVDATRLGGIYFDGAAMPIEEALISAAGRLAREGGEPDVCLVDFATFVSLEKALGSKVRYTEAKARDVDVGFQGLAVQGPTGVIKVIPDLNCQANTAWLLQMDTWALNSLGDCPQILDLDDNRMLREAAADAYEVRIGYYANMSCNAPGYNARVAL
tara:strand:+ start:2059 stop:3357 length:1299 start_codon:yes stop_codon:yes gene_type:complete